MGFFNFLLTPSQRCEQEISKLLNDVARVAKSKTKELKANKEEDKQLIAAIVFHAMQTAVDEIKKERPFQTKYNLPDNKYDKMLLKAIDRVGNKYIPNLNNRINTISMEATMLVAFIKEAGKGRDFIFDKDKTDKEFYDIKFDRIMTACYLMNCFCTKVQVFPRTYHFHIIENGPRYGECFEVQMGPFLQLLADVLERIIKDMPKVYQDKIDAYMYAPFSNENIAISIKIKETLYPKYKYAKKYADKWRKGVIDADYLYVLCR